MYAPLTHLVGVFLNEYDEFKLASGDALMFAMFFCILKKDEFYKFIINKSKKKCSYS